MSKVEIIPFKSEHAKIILELGINEPALELRPEHQKYVVAVEEIGMSFTGLVNKKPIAAGGVNHLWDNVAEGWVIASKEIWKYPITCARAIKVRTDYLATNNNIKRIQTGVKADCKKAIRFAEWLGFKREGLMKKYGPDGSDYYLYAKVY